MPKIDILAYFGTPGGLIKSEQFFKRDIFAHLGLFNVISHKMHQLCTHRYSIGAQSPIYGYFRPPAVQTSLSNFFPQGEPSTNGIF